MTAMRTGGKPAAARGGGGRWVWLVAAVVVVVAGLAVFWWTRSRAIPTTFTYAQAWAMSEQERMRVLVPGPNEPLPKTITIGGESATFYAYAAPGESDWKTVWEPPTGGAGHSLRDEMKMLKPGPGLTILYGQPQGDKVFVFGTVRATLPWGDKRTITMHEDGYKKAALLEPLHLNPQASK